MAKNRKFQIIPIGDKFQVQQYGGFSSWQNRGKPFNTSEEANADMQKRLDAMGPRASRGRAWAHDHLGNRSEQ